MPAHHVDLLTGIGPSGAMIEESRTKPVVGKFLVFGMVPPRLVESEVVLDWPIRALAEFGKHQTEFGFGRSYSVTSPGSRALASVRYARIVSSLRDRPNLCR